MPSGTKGKNVYQASTAMVQQVQSVHVSVSADAGGAALGAALSIQPETPFDAMRGGNVNVCEGSSTDCATVVGGGTGNMQVDEDEDLEDDHNAPPPPTSPPPSIISKRRFSALDLETTSEKMASPPTSSGVTPASQSHGSTNSGSSKQGQVTGAIALTNIGHGFADFNSIYRMDLVTLIKRKHGINNRWQEVPHHRGMRTQRRRL